MTADAVARLPIRVCLRTIRAEPGWWLESARRLDAAGYAGLWAWDHFVGRGDARADGVIVLADERRRGRAGGGRRALVDHGHWPGGSSAPFMAPSPP